MEDGLGDTPNVRATGDELDPFDLKRHSKLNSTVQPGRIAPGGKHKLNSSGFFVFDEEDMKKMTEMSPREAFTSRNLVNHHHKGHSLNFEVVDGKIDNLRHQQRPHIKASTIFNSNTSGAQTMH